MKLFRITLAGCSNFPGLQFRVSYVVAEDPTSAYQKVRDFLDTNDMYFPRERVLDKVELLASGEAEHDDCNTMLLCPETTLSLYSRIHELEAVISEGARCGLALSHGIECPVGKKMEEGKRGDVV